MLVFLFGYDCLNHKSSTRHAYCGPGYLYSHVTSMMKITLKLFLFSVFDSQYIVLMYLSTTGWADQYINLFSETEKNIFPLLHTHTHPSSGNTIFLRISSSENALFPCRNCWCLTFVVDSSNEFDRMDLQLCKDSNAKCTN